jgi:hypothetical protein
MTVTTRVLLVGAGALIAVAGVVWTLQGLGYVTGSFMTGATLWAVIGPVTAVAGLALIAVGVLRRRVTGGRGGS